MDQELRVDIRVDVQKGPGELVFLDDLVSGAVRDDAKMVSKSEEAATRGRKFDVKASSMNIVLRKLSEKIPSYFSTAQISRLTIEISLPDARPREEAGR